jgi:putative transposase
MEIHRAYKVELALNNKQRTVLLQHAGASRFAYNWGLARRKAEYETSGKSSNAIEQHRQLNVLKKTPEYAWCYTVSKCVFQEALRDLDKAYKNFFRRARNGDIKPGFPKFKSRKRGIGSFRLTGHIRVENGRIRLPRIGWLKLKERGYIPVEDIHILSATISEKAGRWFVSVQCRKEIEVSQATGEPVGVDLGIKTLAVVSDGRQFENPRALRQAQRKLKRLQRQLARRKRGGQNWRKTKTRLVRQHQRIANLRKDRLHKVTSAIVAKSKPDSERPSVVVLENLNVSGMMKNHNLAQAISDVSLAEFRRQIAYKTHWYGSEVILAGRFFPSSKLCRHCGCVNSDLKLSDRTWVCDCGKVLDRDLNAAINLKNLVNTTSSVEIDACGESVRPAAESLVISVKQELSIESQMRF